MDLRFLLGKLLQLAVGAVIGAVLGGIITGDPGYWIGWTLGLVGVVLLGVFIGAVVGRQKRQTAAVSGPVLNPEPSAVPAGMPVPSSPRRGSPMAWRVLSIVTIVVGAGLTLIPSFQTVSWIARDIVAGRPFDGRDMQTGIHVQDAFDELVDVIGGTEVTSIYLYADQIVVTAPVSPGDRHVDRYIWEYGRAYREGPDYSQPENIRAELFDAAEIDMNLIAQVVRDAKTDSGIRDIDSVYPYIERFSGEDPELSISLSGAYDDAHYTFTIHGELIEKYGSAFQDR